MVSEHDRLDALGAAPVVQKWPDCRRNARWRAPDWGRFPTLGSLTPHLRTPPVRHCRPGSIWKTGWSGAMRRSSSSVASGPTPPKNTPTSNRHLRR